MLHFKLQASAPNGDLRDPEMKNTLSEHIFGYIYGVLPYLAAAECTPFCDLHEPYNIGGLTVDKECATVYLQESLFY